ncbi:MAG: intradiol ring-cleavage dioxygenase [Chitinophagaceae bacterium]|nr:intradiol ring-cleavage dioxygenase [Chitinophagaceae bacterium]
MKATIIIPLLLGFTAFTACSQPPAHQQNKREPGAQIVGGRCEGCEAIYECPILFDKLNETDTLPGFNEPGQKIEINGTIFKPDGKTPAAGVIMYVYQTDQKGVYPKKGNEKGLDRQHGYIRGWIKTNALGQYRIYTLVPASYPNSSNPKHIHTVIKEPGKTEYWIDDFVFDDDPLLPEKERTRARPAGGSGLLKPRMKDGMLRAARNIILGLHIENYPQAKTKN